MNSKQELSSISFSLDPLSLPSHSYTSLPNLGNHLILEFFGVSPSINLNSIDFLDSFLRSVLSQCSVTIESSTSKQFEPQGVTLLYLLSESHLSIHTWPQHQALTLDFYHCGDKSRDSLKLAEQLLCDFFGWSSCTNTLLLKRGQLSSYLCNDFVDKTEILHNVRLLHREQSPFQEIKIFDTVAMGRILVLDGAVQFSEQNLQSDDNYTWDMTHAVISKNVDEVKDLEVMIIGGGDLIIAAYILNKYSEEQVRKVTVVEIDERVIELTKQYFKLIGDVVKKAGERLEVVCRSGAEYMREIREEKRGKIDGVIIDCTDFALDEGSIAAELFTPQFYENINELLRNGKGFSQQITKVYYKEAFEERVRKGGFERVEYIESITPEYGGFLPLGVGFKS